MDNRSIDFTDNLPELTVSELSNQVKFTVESNFQRVKVRGEISRPMRASSGHLYLTLKDENSVLDGICWRGTAQRLSIEPEDGLEVICIGKITTYPGRSKYQIIIEELELAGEGALLKLLEERRKKFLNEGVFDQDRKLSLPKYPALIGVVTSPTGAVIKDILHRLKDRFPLHVVIWPVAVQGSSAAQEIAEAIRGFNKISENDSIQRPDLLIVARGGGSLEDLWCFNEEVVVRSVAESLIPIISAVGHETDTTLIDFASDLRAPTPTAAAEMAVPVRSELISELIEHERRMILAMDRNIEGCDLQLSGFARALGDPTSIIDNRSQRLDYLDERLGNAIRSRIKDLSTNVGEFSSRLVSPDFQIMRKSDVLASLVKRLGNAGKLVVENAEFKKSAIGSRLKINIVRQTIKNLQIDLDRLSNRQEDIVERFIVDKKKLILGLDRLLEASSFQRTLEKGFALVRDETSKPIFSAKLVKPGQALQLQFRDGTSNVRVIKSFHEDQSSAKKSTSKQDTLF